MNPDETSRSPLEIRLLGRFQVSVRGRTLSQTSIKGRKARSLLKLVALQRHCRIVRDRAMEALWPDLDRDAAASQLYKALHHIRKALTGEADEASDWIEITDELIRLDPPGDVEIDAHRFEEKARAGLRDNRTADLETAVSLYAGDLLPTDLYAEWASLPREHYRQLYLDVLTALAAQYEQTGAFSEAAQMLRLAIEKDPALESAHRALMRIFARRGQPTRAFRQYDFCREMLHDELGTGPSRRTKAVLESVRQHRLSGQTGPSSIRASTPSPVPPLVDRVSELTAIDRLLDRLSSGVGGTLLIRGSMGTGKTRLIEEVVLKARRRRLSVFSCAADRETSSGAYGPFVELFEAVLRDRPDLEQYLPEELGELVPRFTGDGAPVPHADRLAARSYLFAQVQRFFAQLAEEGPLLLTVDDLHAADEESRALFHYLSRHGADLPILFAGATRETDTEPPSREASPGQERGTTVLNLTPLTREEHAALLDQQPEVRVPEPLVDRIYELSEGNPLFALELVRGQADDEARAPAVGEPADELEHAASSRVHIPPSLRHMTERELEAISTPARRLLYTAAVIGRYVRYELLASTWSEVTDSEEEAIFDPLEELVDAGLLEEDGLDYSFRHALVRETVYTSISEARRRTLHTSVAHRLVAMAEESDEEPVEEIAHHFIRGGETRQAVHHLVRAAEQAESVYAHDHALQLYRRALSLLGDVDGTGGRRLRCDVLERVGDVYRACGRLERSYDAYEEAAALVDEVPMSEPDLVELHRKSALVATFRTEMDRSKEHLERAFELVTEDARTRARLLVTKALHLWHLNRLEEAYEVARDALTRAESVDASAEASQACEILALTCLPLGRWEEGLEYEMQRQVHGWSPEIVVATDAHLCLWEYHLTGDQPFEQAQSFMQRVAEQASELGDLRCVAVCHYALGTMHIWRGEHREAVDELDRSLELHERVGSPAGMAYTLARTGVLHTMQGATERGWRAVRNGVEKAERAAVRDHCLQRLYGVGLWNRLEAGDSARVRELVERSRTLLEEAGPCGACSLELYPWLAYHHLCAGEVARVRECEEVVSSLAATTGNPIGEAAAAMIESTIHAAEEKPDRTRELRRRAFELAERAVEDTSHAPVVHYLDRMADQLEELQETNA